jgi:hypothetical protein
MEALTQDQADSLDAIRSHRHELAHEDLIEEPVAVAGATESRQASGERGRAASGR